MSVAVADVPVTELVGLRCRGQDLSSTSDLSAHRCPTALLLVDEFGVVCQDQGQVGLSGFVHVASMGHFREEVKGSGSVPRLSHPVQEVCHCLLILLKGGETIRKPCGDLTGAGLNLRQITTLGEDLLGVGVVRLIHHAVIIGAGDPAPWVQVDSASGVTPPQR